MADLELDREYSEAEIVEVLGESHEVIAGEWHSFPRAIACLATLGKSRFCGARRFEWTVPNELDCPVHFESHLFTTRVPREVRASRTEDSRPLHLFVRGDQGTFTHVGRLARSHAFTATSADFELEHALPTRLFERFARPRWRPDWDRTIGDELRMAESRCAARLELVRSVAEFWNGPITEADGIPTHELGESRMPGALRWWFELAGRRSGLVDGQNSLFSPAELHVDEAGKLTFYTENQGVRLWSTLPEGEDPPIWGRADEDEPWSPEGMTLSEFMLGAAVFEGMSRAPFVAITNRVTERVADELRRRLPRLPLHPWRWPADPTCFHERGGLFMMTADEDVYLSARTAEAFDLVRELVDEDWDVRSI